MMRSRLEQLVGMTKAEFIAQKLAEGTPRDEAEMTWAVYGAAGPDRIDRPQAEAIADEADDDN